MEISRHNFILTLKIVICCTTLVVCLPACSTDDDSSLPGIEEDVDGRALRQLTISDASLTRATIDDATLAATWDAGDEATYVNLSKLSFDLYFGNLKAASSGQTTLLKGDVYCGLGDNLALIYPSVTPATNGSYTVNLSGQKGTLADVGKRYRCGKGDECGWENGYGRSLIDEEPARPVQVQVFRRHKPHRCEGADDRLRLNWLSSDGHGDAQYRFERR